MGREKTDIRKIWMEEKEKYLGVVLRGREWEGKAGKWSEEG